LNYLGGSTTSSSAGSLSVSAANSSHRQPRFDSVKGKFNPTDTNRDASTKQEEFRTWPPNNDSQTNGQSQQQQQAQ